jgi:hypothetical protein
MSGSAMKPKRNAVSDGMRAEYNFDYTKGVRGKYYKRIQEEGTNVVLLDRDVQKAFPDSIAVNEALRSILKTKRSRRQTPRRATRRRAA